MITKLTKQFFNNYNKAILSNVEFFEKMDHANTDALEQGDFERKERKENQLTAEQMDSLEIMNEDDEHFNKLVDGDFKEIDNGIWHTLKATQPNKSF